MRGLQLFSMSCFLAIAGCSSARQTAQAPPPDSGSLPPPPPPPKPQARPSPDRPSVDHPTVVARDLLVGPAPEAPGFGLYSYVLLGYPPLNLEDRTSDQYQRAFKTAEAFLQMDQVGDMRQAGVNPADINLTYFPVLAPPPRNSADVYLAAYNYPRSHAILGLTGKSGAGPYIVSTQTPLTGARSLPSQYLLQDLSEVPPRLVGLWVQHFRQQSIQPRFWEKPQDEFRLRLRTSIGEVTDEMFAAVMIWHIGRNPS